MSKQVFKDSSASHRFTRGDLSASSLFQIRAFTSSFWEYNTCHQCLACLIPGALCVSCLEVLLVWLTDTLQSHRHFHTTEGDGCSLYGLVWVLQRCCQFLAHAPLSYLKINSPLLFMPWLQVCVLQSMGGNELLNCLGHIICTIPQPNSA